MDLKVRAIFSNVRAPSNSAFREGQGIRGGETTAMNLPLNLLQDRAPAGDVTFEARDGGAPADMLTLRSPAGAAGGGVRLTFEGTARDWTAARALTFTLRANGAHRLRVHIEHGHGTWTFFLVPRPGLSHRVVVRFDDLLQRPPNTSHPGYLSFGGGPHPVDLADMRALTLTFNQVSPINKEMTLGDFSLSDTPVEPAILDPRVVVDDWGQWTGERGARRTEAEIRSAWAMEPTTFAGFPNQTDETGASTGGPATGFFRVAQDAATGRWWLADPDGRPFFSIGCDCVRPVSEGPVGEREALFADLSDAAWRGRDAATAKPWSNSHWADFYGRNLRERYKAATADDWHAAWSRQTAARLRSWGFNTVGNWSDPDLTCRGLLPYTTNISSLAPLCARLPDVYAPDFAARVRALVEPEVTPYAGDKMLVGYFVGNEPHWTFGGVGHPFNDLWTRPDEYPHTRETALAWLRRTYADDLTRLNAAWNTALTAWDELRTRPDALPDVRLGTDALKHDADAFLGEVLGHFYDTCCREIRACDPDHLLLGGRFYTARMAEPYVRACRAFDVYSFNCYQWDPPLADIDRITELSGRPVLVGEFHYGVEDRGLTASLVAVQSQQERGLAYRHFVEQAAAHPSVVGLHWFQWVDQPCTGRFDGECYNIGLVDVTDIPYDDFLVPVKETHARLYDVCRGALPPYAYPNERPAAW